MSRAVPAMAVSATAMTNSTREMPADRIRERRLVEVVLDARATNIGGYITGADERARLPTQRHADLLHVRVIAGARSGGADRHRAVVQNPGVRAGRVHVVIHDELGGDETRIELIPIVEANG